MAHNKKTKTNHSPGDEPEAQPTEEKEHPGSTGSGHHPLSSEDEEDWSVVDKAAREIFG